MRDPRHQEKDWEDTLNANMKSMQQKAGTTMQGNKQSGPVTRLLRVFFRFLLTLVSIMSFNKLIWVCGGFLLADTSAVAAINRALRGGRIRSPYPCSFGTVHYGVLYLILLAVTVLMRPKWVNDKVRLLSSRVGKRGDCHRYV